ncbi:MAG: primosomal protein N' [Flavobacteriales bacterium]|nr:primosomal protein N' [Flavobacteriales bacterium]
MSNNKIFIDVILPVSVPNTFTYYYYKKNNENENLIVGQRVVVPFGKGNKLYTAIVKKIHQIEPTEYLAKEINSILDNAPIVNTYQFQLWEWISDYYIANLGDVFNAALPNAFKINIETKIYKNLNYEGDPINDLSDTEYLIYEALEVRNTLEMIEISEILSGISIHKTIKSLIEKRAVVLGEELKEKYKPKLIPFVRLSSYANEEQNLKIIFENLSKKPKQTEILLSFLKLNNRYHSPTLEVNKIELQKTTNATSVAINQMVESGIFEIYEKEDSRLKYEFQQSNGEVTLNEHQQQAYKQIKDSFNEKDVTLLFGITGSGKTEIYIKLIKDAISDGKQVLYLLPEIALTTQLIVRLQKVFGNRIGVYHSKFNENERAEVWNEVLKNNNEKFQIIMGARSALFLPFSNLGLIIVDEEHETSYKQFDPAPRYQARDTSIVLAKLHNAKILLGSATPSVESYYNALQKKYGYVELNNRFGGMLLPQVFCSDVKEATRKKQMKSHFTPEMIQHIDEAIKNKEQIILFQNRRGYAPFMVCEDCGQVPNCKHCDVSLTYHKASNQLKCHYCGSSKKMVSSCPACGSNRIVLKGFGTEQIEEELEIYFPSIRIARMDADTTRNKNAYRQIINTFEDRNIDVLVGTQMVTKGLDFDNVALVGILNADSMLHFPDFRAFERAFQLMCQVSGRAGRRNKRGKVLIQTYEPFHTVIQQVIKNDYKGMYEYEILQRRNFNYPPFVRIILFTLKHVSADQLNQGADEFANELKSSFGNRVLGPEFPIISRIKNQYQKNILLKVERTFSVEATRSLILAVKNKFEVSSKYKSVKIQIDVDPY